MYQNTKMYNLLCNQIIDYCKLKHRDSSNYAIFALFRPVLFNMWIIVVPNVFQWLGFVNTQEGNTRSKQDVVLWSLLLGEVIVIAISYSYLHYLISIGSPHYILHFSTVAHMKDFALGGLVAIYCELSPAMRGILPSEQKYVPHLSTVQRLIVECGILVISIHLFLIVPFWPIDLTQYYSYGCLLLSAETLMLMVLLAVAQKERLQGERMFMIFPICAFYNNSFAMMGIVSYALYVFHLPIIVWTDTACHSSSDVYCLARGAIVIIFILIVASVISFKFEVPLMQRIAAVKKFSSVFIGMVSSMVLMLCLILLVTKGAENPRGTSSDLDNMGGLSHPLNIDGNSSHAYYTLIEHDGFHNSLLNEVVPYFRNQGLFKPIMLKHGDKPSRITNLRLYETFDTIPEGVTISVLIVFKSVRSCPLLELLPRWIETQRKQYGSVVDSFHMLEIYESLLPMDKRYHGLSSPCEMDSTTESLFDSVVLTDISKINNTNFKEFCNHDCQIEIGTYGTIFNIVSLNRFRLALTGMMTSITEQAPHLRAFFDSNILHGEYLLSERADANVTISDVDIGMAVVGDSTAHRFGIYLKRLNPSIIDKCQHDGVNNPYIQTMQKITLFNFGKPGINFPQEMADSSNSLRNELRSGISKYGVTVLLLSSMHLNWNLLTPNLAGEALGDLLSILNFFYSAGIERIYMVDYQYSYVSAIIRKGYRIPTKSFINDGPLTGVDTNKLAAAEGSQFLYHYFLRFVSNQWDRHEDFLRRAGNKELYVNHSCVNDRVMRQTLCYGDLLDGSTLSKELLPHLMELKNMLRIINLSFMSCPSPKTAHSYIMCKQGGFGYTDVRPDGTHIGGRSGDFIAANLLAQCVEDLHYNNLGDMSGNKLPTIKKPSTLPFAPVASLEAMDICHFENIQMLF